MNSVLLALKRREDAVTDFRSARRECDPGRALPDRNRTGIDSAVWMHEVCALSETQAANKKQTVTCKVEGELPTLHADHNRLVHALLNLIGNAIEFTPENGEISVRAHLDGDCVLITVIDNGPGIPADDVAHVFEKYWHATRRQRGGTGLGLAITKGIVDAHGGKIRVEPSREIGMQISFTIPVSRGENTAGAG